MIDDILLPIDGSDAVEPVLEMAAAIARPFNATVHLLHVAEPPRLIYEYGDRLAYDTVMRALRSEGHEHLIRTARRLRDFSITSIETVVQAGHPAEVILAFSQEHEVDLIVMGTHGHRGLRRTILGSVAEEVVRRSAIPVLSVRLREEHQHSDTSS